jgi:hypothetical protein
MRDLNDALKRLGDRNKDGSYATPANRARTLSLMADQLYALGYTHLHATALKGRHVNALVRLWQTQGLTPGTLKNRMAALRWWAEKVGRAWVLARDNTPYGIPDRQYVTQGSKAQTLHAATLDQIHDPYVRASVALQQAFGLRRKEAVKFQPGYADRGDRLVLKASWTKGGKAREVPLRTPTQRELLDRVQQLAGQGSLIPSQRTYVEHLRVYQRQTANAGLSKLHGRRHAYAQQRYAALTGWPAPAAGGPSRCDLTPAQQTPDAEARLTISRE